MDGSDYGDQYDVDTFVRRVTSVADPGLRRRQVERHLTTVDPPTVADHLQIVLARGVRGDPRATELLFAIAAFVETAEGGGALALEAINLAARTADVRGVGWWLLDPPPFRAIDPRAAKQTVGASQSLGHRRAAATGPDLRVLERLTHDDHPMVIDRVCQNPRTPEALILSIVTRRPIAPALIDAVAHHARWLQRREVRLGIVMNPYAKTGLSLRVLPTLGIREWSSIRHVAQVHLAVRGFAEYLVRLQSGDASGPGPESIVPTLH